MARTHKAKEKIGNRYGMLVVLEPFYKTNRNGKNKLWYKCKCDCGAVKDVSNNNLRGKGGVRSCGCNQHTGNRAQDIAGKRFGDLVAIRPTEKRVRKSIVWEFRCDCGMTRDISSGEVVNGKIQSCGCRRKNPDRELAAWTRSFNRALRHKYTYGDFSDIDVEFFKKKTSMDCAYCGQSPHIEVCDGKTVIARRNTLDRIDPKSGYWKCNVLPSCLRCNQAKGKMTYYEWIIFLAKAYKHFVESNNFMRLADPGFEKHQVSMIFPDTKRPSH